MTSYVNVRHARAQGELGYHLIKVPCAQFILFLSIFILNTNFYNLGKFIFVELIQEERIYRQINIKKTHNLFLIL